jgi:dihydroflavonol-4-reductase
VSRVFVTGGSGFIGGALIRRLIDDGHRVQALARSPAAAKTVSALGAEAIGGDLSDRDALAGAFDGARLVFHAAGVNELCPRNELRMFETNVTGTGNVVAASGAAGVERVIYTSSAVVLGEAAGTVGSETSSHRGHYLSTYERSKHEAELVAFETAREADVDVVAVNPSSVQGPGRVGGSARIFLYALRSERPWLFDTWLSIVDIDDCVDAHVRAAEVGEAGRRYVVSGPPIEVREAVQLLESVAGVVTKPRMVSSQSVRRVGIPLSYLLRYIPLGTPVCPDMLRVLLHGHRYDGTLAARELGLRYTPLEDTLRAGVEWYRAENLI